MFKVRHKLTGVVHSFKDVLDAENILDCTFWYNHMTKLWENCVYVEV